MQTSSQALYRTGRAFIGILSLCAGIIKITPHSDVPQSGGLPFVKLLLPLTILMEFGCGLMLIVGWKLIYIRGDSGLVHHSNDSNISCVLECRRHHLLDPVNQFPEDVAMFGGLLMIIGAERAKGGMHMTEYPAVIVQLVSAYDFSSTLNRLSDAFERAHMQIFARIDQRTLAGFSRV